MIVYQYRGRSRKVVAIAVCTLCGVFIQLFSIGARGINCDCEDFPLSDACKLFCGPFVSPVPTPDPPPNEGFGSGGVPVHMIFRSGNGTPELAITPKRSKKIDHVDHSVDVEGNW